MSSWPPPADLRSDCTRCAALCCVALPLTGGADFAIDKAAGAPCPNLDESFRCRRHDTLRADGFAGCVTFECFGAGQRVTQVTFGGRDWRTDPAIASEMFATFGAQRRLHELVLLVSEAEWLVEGSTPAAGTAAELGSVEALLAAVQALLEAVRPLLDADAATVLAVDLDDHHRRVGVVLGEVSRAVRSARGGLGPALRGADLAGSVRRGRDLRRSDLRGALLLGADLRDADLRDADLLGTDLRGARLDGADLRGAIFLTAPQVAAATGDVRTRLADHLAAPRHWGR